MVYAYTDGSANVKNKLGGFGVYIIDSTGNEYFFSEGYENTKTGRMELRAVITALQKVNKSEQLVIYSDSMYCVNCVREGWMWKWKRENFWGKKNVDLIKIYLEEYEKFKIPPMIKHIKGHTDFDDQYSIGNSIADKLADYRNKKHYKLDVYEEAVL